MSKALEVGDQAPEFTLNDADGQSVSLRDFRGQNSVVLYFYPKDLTPGCTKQACAFSSLSARFAKAGAAIYGVSFDDAASHQKFIAKEKLKIPLLSDTERKVADLYGVYQEKNMYGKKIKGIVRTTFLIDREGKIAKIYPKVKVEGHAEAVLKDLQEL